MTIKILESAIDDLERGRKFYARHGLGVGDYLITALVEVPTEDLMELIHFLRDPIGGAPCRLDESSVNRTVPRPL